MRAYISRAFCALILYNTYCAWVLPYAAFFFFFLKCAYICVILDICACASPALVEVGILSCLSTVFACWTKTLDALARRACFVLLCPRCFAAQEDRELVAKLRPFARFSTPKEHDELIDNLLLAKKIRCVLLVLLMLVLVSGVGVGKWCWC